MLEFVAIVLVIALLGAIVALVRVSTDRARVMGERDVAIARLADLESDSGRMKESFKALASETMHKESEQFLRLAEQKFAAREASAVAEMDKRRTAVDQLLQPIQAALSKTHDELRKLEGERGAAYAGLKTQIAGMLQANDQLRSETSRLAQSLSKPTVRGRYGEIQLQRVAELAGMQAYCDFNVQDSVRDAEGRLLKPDMIVRMPNERVVAIDAKTNLDGYLEAIKAPTPEQAEAHLKRYANHVVEQAQALAKRGYWKQYDGSPEFVVMFVPGDQFIDAALERRPDLIEIAAKSNVILASPSTLIGLLRAVELGWREQRFSQNAKELQELGKELMARFGVALGHVDKVGASLERAMRSYNDFVGSIDSRVMPTLRKFEESGAGSGTKLAELKPAEGVPRRLAAAPLEIQPPSPNP